MLMRSVRLIIMLIKDFVKRPPLTVFDSPIIQMVCLPNFAQVIVFKCYWENTVLPEAFGTEWFMQNLGGGGGGKQCI